MCWEKQKRSIASIDRCRLHCFKYVLRQADTLTLWRLINLTCTASNFCYCKKTHFRPSHAIHAHNFNQMLRHADTFSSHIFHFQSVQNMQSSARNEAPVPHTRIATGQGHTAIPPLLWNLKEIFRNNFQKYLQEATSGSISHTTGDNKVPHSVLTDSSLWKVFSVSSPLPVSRAHCNSWPNLGGCRVSVSNKTCQAAAYTPCEKSSTRCLEVPVQSWISPGARTNRITTSSAACTAHCISLTVLFPFWGWNRQVTTKKWFRLLLAQLITRHMT